jgi:hypothetical protein
VIKSAHFVNEAEDGDAPVQSLQLVFLRLKGYCCCCSFVLPTLPKWLVQPAEMTRSGDDHGGYDEDEHNSQNLPLSFVTTVQKTKEASALVGRLAEALGKQPQRMYPS